MSNPQIKAGKVIVGVAALAYVASTNREKQEPGRGPWDPATDRLVDYDYIVAGGGAAGCAVASRLAEDPDVRVLVLEAGTTDDVPPSMTPAMFPTMIDRPQYDWRIRTVPQSHCNNRAMLQPRGKLLGGSSAINGMVYHRGPPSDYDLWGRLGNMGWSYADSLNYFKKAERFNDPTLPVTHPRGPPPGRTIRPEYETFDADYHGTEGPWQVSYHHFFDLNEAFIKANQALNVPFNQDFNGKTTVGVNRVQTFIQRDAVRSSSARAYLSPKSHVPGGGLDDQGRRRGHIRVVYQAHVERVLVKNRRGSKVAIGVEFRDRHGVVHKVCAVREVIVSAGSFLSPVILQASGIGSPQPMIPLIHPLAGVGMNLTDHISTSIIFRAPDSCKTLGNSMTFFQKLGAKYDYRFHRRGVLTTNIVGAVSFVRLEEMAPEFVEREKAAGTWQDRASGPKSPHFEFIVLPNYHRPSTRARPTDAATSAYVTILVVLLNPCSVGWVGIKATARPKKDGQNVPTPVLEPLVDPNYYSDPFDLRAMVEGVRFGRRLAREMANHPSVGRPCEEVVPGERISDHDDKAIQEFLRAESETLYHPVGTCKMAPQSDPMSVVDERLRVRGIDRLRVIDASIMPVVPAAHTTAPTIMIAEKGADMIKEDWEDPSKKDSIRNTLSRL